ncbi:MAG: TldD/PmbA family protein [candidate division Zixibacteria bacterium]|nr:TldD/PmbA family protein [candidate division Zixibacteria bacterium]
MKDFKIAGVLAMEKAISAGATYADFRYVHTESEELSYSDGAPEDVSHSIDRGFGIRVIVDGAWGFCSSANTDVTEIDRIVRKAINIGKASALLQKIPIELAANPQVKDSFKTKIKTDPFQISLTEKLAFLAHLDELMGKHEGIRSRSGYLDFRKIYKGFVNSEGSEIEQTIYHSGAGISVAAMRSHRDRASRSYPANEGQFETRGYEFLDHIDFENNIPIICEEAAALLDAEPCPEKTTDIILDGSHMSLVIHESIGHPLELDRVFGVERNFSGTSFAIPDMLDNLKYGSDIINVTADSTAPHGLGTFGFDDDGVAANREYLIKDGVLVNYLSSRETAARIGKASTGANRADGWGNMPICRMTNTILQPGDKTLEDLISGIDDGILMETTSSWSIDDTRESFHFGCELGREIKGGKLGKLIKNPTYASNTIEFWNSCDGIGNESLWRLWGTPNCGKGQPAQNGRVGQGAAPARFRQVKVGV